MTRLNVLILAAALAGGATLGVAADAAKQPAPRIAVEPAGFDFGRALVRKTLSKEFAIRNAGDATLEILSVKTSCGCTAALPASRSIEPGGHTLLKVSLDTRSQPGKLRRMVYVRSNDPGTSVIEIPLSVEVVASKDE